MDIEEFVPVLNDQKKTKNDKLKDKEFRIIGIGTSAGGLEALKIFFDNVPHDFQHSFVVIQHLSPNHKSLMKELLEKNTDLPIIQATNNLKIEKGNIYLLPPRKNIKLKNKKLLLNNKPNKDQLNLPINIFFDSLACEERENSIAIILSGTGSDGTSGIREIHEAGGLVLVQDPEESKFNGMPLSAINTGVVDYILSAKQIPKAVSDFINDNGKFDLEREIENNINIFEKLLSHVRNVMGYDFNYFKKPTLIRRIAKRINLGKFNTFQEYFAHTLTDLKEVETLHYEFLISVTDFYRDREMWNYIKDKILPNFIDGKNKNGKIKIWSVGCSTGQEPYSIADMIYQELFNANRLDIDVKIFASDASANNIKHASKGYYSISDLKSLSLEESERMFEDIARKPHIKDHLRQMVVFSKHDVLIDPPFGKMDMVFCRNLLIYVNKESQKSIIGTLQYSILKNGYLALGKSESLGDYKDYFKEVGPKNKVYKNIKTTHRFFSKNIPLESTKYISQNITNINQSGTSISKYEFVEFLNKSLPTAFDLSFMMVDFNYKILEAVGNFSKYLKLPNKGFSNNILDLVPEYLKSPLNLGFNKALKTTDKVKVEAINTNDYESTHEVIDVIIIPQQSSNINEPSLSNKYLLIFQQRIQKETNFTVVKGVSDNNKSKHIKYLESELKDAKYNLTRLQHELEIRNEELQTSNEELLATNEELQSSNEELQSLNEELYTVNAELNQKVRDLAEANAQIDNILKSSNINTLFLDKELNIRKFTPGILDHFNIVLNDLGRPLRAFTHNFGKSGDDLLDKSKKVIEEGKVFQKEIRDQYKKWYLQRISPFYDSKNIISGVVITFVDISDLKKVEEALTSSRQHYMALYENAPDGYFTLNNEGKISNCNSKTALDLGYNSKNDLFGKKIIDLVHPKWKKKHEEDFSTLLIKGKIENSFLKLIKKDSNTITVLLNGKAVFDKEGNVESIIGTFRDLTEFIETKEELKEKTLAFEHVLENTLAGYWDWNITENLSYLSPTFKMMFGYEDQEIDNSIVSWKKIIHPDDFHLITDAYTEHTKSKGKIPYDCKIRCYHKNGSIVWVWCKGKVIQWNKDKNPVRMVGINLDISSMKAYEEQLKKSNQHLERFAYLASHDLQEPLRTINNFVTLLKEENAKKLNNDAKIYIDYILKSSNRMGELVKSILEYSRIGKRNINNKVDLSILVEDVKNDLSVKIKESNAEISYDKLPVVIGNSIEFHSLFLNLLSNAIKFVKEGESPKITIFSTKNKGGYQISIKDNGMGIAEKNKIKIFEIFKKLHNKDDFEGTGIGLAHCKKIIELYGGEIWVDSQIEKGSTFHLTFKNK